MKRKLTGVVAVCTALALALTACGGEKKGTKTTTEPKFNAANGAIFNPSDKKGGTMKFAISSDWDSVDPGDTYYALSWNLIRLYTRALVMFKPGPGKESQKLVGDLAEDVGKSSDGGKTWTYKLREGLKYEDGTPITSKDVEYGVSRSLEKGVLVNGPTYFNDLLVQIGVNADDLDNRLIDGDVHVDIAGTGVQPAALSRVLGQPDLKKRADNPPSARLWYTSINPQVKPLDNIECRKAVMYASDRTEYQTAYGGPLAGGKIATGLLPPVIPGYKPLDVYTACKDNKGDLDKAKESLKACGKPDGFSTNVAYRAERPKEKATAEALQRSLKRVGIKLTLKPYPTGDYFALYAGKPSYRNKNNLGLMTNGWAADWPDGFGFLSQIVDSRVIRPEGGSSNCSVMIPEVDKMLDDAIAEPDAKKREVIWSAIDKRVMEEAVILPGVWATAVTLRGKGLTNVFVNEAIGMYDYTALGLE